MADSMFIMGGGGGVLLKIKYMERLDQGHLYPKLEVPRLTHLGRESNAVRGEHSSKDLLQWRIKAIRDIYKYKPTKSTKKPTQLKGLPFLSPMVYSFW